MENDKQLNKILNYQASLEDLEKFWADRGVPMSPYKKVDYQYPTKKSVNDDSTPRQTFRTFTEFVKTV